MTESQHANPSLRIDASDKRSQFLVDSPDHARRSVNLTVSRQSPNQVVTTFQNNPFTITKVESKQDIGVKDSILTKQDE